MSRPRSGPAAPVAPYRRRVEAYDLVYGRKPYAAEARAVRAIARRYGRRPLRTLLDVACGTGRHLEILSRWYDCTGVDASPAMLALARRRAPGVRFRRCRMETLELRRRFDVVTCLFSAIGYARSGAELRRVLGNLARHLAPGGVLLVEPWLTPRVFRAGRVNTLLARSPELQVARMNDVRGRRGRSVLDFHYLVGAEGRVEHFVERHELALFDVATMRDAFRRAGLRVVYRRGGLPMRRGLYIGYRPA